MAVAARFITAACRYWIGTYPAIRREIRRMRRRAECIPDPTLRHLALDILDSKWGDLEGAGAFAAFAPIRLRARVARLLVCLQGIYDYADTLAEQPSLGPQADAITLHSAMLDALKPGTPPAAYYVHHNAEDDGGYLASLIERCHVTVEQLPAYSLVVKAAREHTQRIVDYQARINHEREQGYPSFAPWAETETPAGSCLYWWETGAACGSSLAVLALLAAAADASLTDAGATAIEATYWPWAGALHTLLDNLIDREEDSATRQHNLTGHYPGQDKMTERLALLAGETAKRADEVPSHHRLILAGMVALYLSDEQAWTAFARPASERVLAATGPLAKPALLLLRARRLALKARRRPPAPPSSR
jgi:tetraprenyl-beta-curcumene synthase